MIDQDGNGALTLEPDQLRVLEEIILYGGVQTVRHNRNHTHYAELVKKKFIEATPLSKREMRYNVTISGRLFIASQT
jgi:hypothetical protein